MSAVSLLEWTNILELVLGTGLLFVMWRRRVLVEHVFLALFLFVHTTAEAISIPVLFFRKFTGLSKHAAYTVYFYTSWTSFVLTSILFIFMVYGVYALALRPFEPLRKLGMIIFRWVCGISIVLAVAIGIGPHVFRAGWLATALGQLQQSISILTLCLLLFVCFALKPLGIRLRSRLFGTSLGLGIMATANLVQSAWMPTSTGHTLYSTVYALTGFGTSVCLMVWTVYFYLPEPKRRMVLLPTTSPYFFWNRISEALGDAPGFVAVNGVTPDIFAPGELEALEAASTPLTRRHEDLGSPIAAHG